MTKCTECKEGEMVIRNGKYGDFMACDNYPECKHTEKLAEGQKSPVMPSKGEYHLTIEQSRSNALNSAIEWCISAKLTDYAVLMGIAKKFETYILTGA